MEVPLQEIHAQVLALHEQVKFKKLSIAIPQTLLLQSLMLANCSYGEGVEKLSSQGFVDTCYFTRNIFQKYNQAPVSKAVNSVKNILNIKRRIMQNNLNAVFTSLYRPEKTVVCIAIAGTTKNIHDWQVNMDMETEQGYHKGYLQNTKQLLALANVVEFPNIAKSLGLTKLSLQDVIEECKQENSRFVLWFTGHSKGAALLQVAMSLLQAEGVKHMLGIGFAAPAVVNHSFGGTRANLPILLLQNSADVVGRLASNFHLGYILQFHGVGNAYFPNPKLAPDSLIHYFLSCFATVQNAGQGLCFMYAMAAYLQKRGIAYQEEYHKYIAMLLKSSIGSFLSQSLESIEKMHLTQFGYPMPKWQVHTYFMSILHQCSTYTIKEIVIAYLLAFQAPHKLFEDDAITPYLQMVKKANGFCTYIEEGARPRLLTGRFVLGHSKVLRTQAKPVRYFIRNGKLN